MPAHNESNVRHLLRRAEFVDRQARVDELLALPSLTAAVDNVLATPANPPSVTFRGEDADWERGEHLTHFWLDRMAHDSSRPLQERMAFFWHGHLCSEFGKVGSAELMREQIDLYRRDGLGNLRDMVKEMSTQVAMLRYLDNNENRASSPNQNFARELMELFLLEVGNYTEPDVEAATAAWTGHTDDWETDLYEWRNDWHDASTKQFLGQTINNGGDPTQHGYEVIDVILGDGVIPAGAGNVANRERASRLVAAEFLSKKLWQEFADTEQPAAAIAAMRDALVGADFDVAPWVRTMLLRDEFYSDAVKNGLVRQPTEFLVSLLVATGRRSDEASPLWLAEGTGQRLLFPPNVSGWKPNGYWVNASAMERRAAISQSFTWRVLEDYWGEGGAIELAGGGLLKDDILERIDGVPVMSGADIVDALLALSGLWLLPATRSTIAAHLDSLSVWHRWDAVLLVFLAPENHIA
ncbi:MAG: DUF1800 family protein [Ilumatobacteraceae bacterium]